MAVDEALESAAVASLAGSFALEHWGPQAPRQPHHTASAVAWWAGAATQAGEISLAHHGVLFLDELPSSPRAALEALREPLETGRITIARAAQRAEFPARFQLIAAMNPCPAATGRHPARLPLHPDQVARYQARLSGPLLDRIDLHVEVPALAPQELLQASRQASPAPRARARVAQARQRALQRQGAQPGFARASRSTPRPGWTPQQRSSADRRSTLAGRPAPRTGR